MANIANSVTDSVSGAGQVVKHSFWSTVKDPQILLYPFLAWLLVAVTGTFAASTIFAHWYDRVFTEATTVVTDKTAFIAGTLAFTLFYAALISSYFTVAVSASVLAKLNGHPTKPLHGLVRVWECFPRVTNFAVLSLFMFPVGVYAQRHKLPKGLIGVIGSSMGLSMAQLAPEILSSRKSFKGTVREAIETLGKKWKEGLALKVGMYILFGLVFILPKLIQAGFFSSPSADKVGWAASLILGASTYVVFKVINSIFTTTLYYHAKKNK